MVIHPESTTPLMWPLVAMLVLGASFANADLEKPTPETIARAIKELGADRFSVREQASAYLWRVGRVAEPALRDALKSSDPEVARRANALMEKIQWGIFADTPQEIVELIQRYRLGDSQAKSQVIEQLPGKGRQGDETLVRLFLAATDSPTRDLFLRQDLSGTPVILNRVLWRGDFALAEQILEGAARGERLRGVANYATFLHLRGRLDERIAHFRGKSRPQQEDLRILAYLHWAKGDLEPARRAAEKVSDRSVLAAILYEQGDWKELALHHHPKRGVHVADELEELAFLAAYQRLAGQTKEFAETAARIRKRAEEEMAKKDGDAWFWTEALLINEQLPDALALLIKAGSTGTAFDLLQAQMRYREAFALSATAKAEKHKGWVYAEIRKGQALHELGEREQARRLLDQLADEIIDLKVGDAYASPYLIEIEYKIGLQEQAFRHCTAYLAREDAQRSRVGVFWSVYPKDVDTPQTWWWFFRQAHPQENHVATMNRVRQLMAGQVERAELERLIGALEAASRALEPLHRRIKLEAAARTCFSAGLTERGQALLEKAAPLGDTPHPDLSLGDSLAEQKRWKEAAERYGRAVGQRGYNRAVATYLQGWALRQAGAEEEARKLLEIATLLPLADDHARSNLAWALEKRGLTKEARDQTRLNRDDDYRFDTDALNILAEEAAAREDHFQAAACYQRLFLHAIPTNCGYLEMKYYLVIPFRIHFHRARGFLAAGNVAEALPEIDECLKLLPGEIDVPILVLPALEKLGHQAVAEKLFTTVYQRHEQICTEFPGSAEHHNALAWMSARCRRRLDQAVVHARHAAQLAPQNPAFLDTLAEVQFQRGEKEQAIAHMKRCIELAPERAYFRAQLQRFEMGDRGVPIPLPPGTAK